MCIFHFMGTLWEGVDYCLLLGEKIGLKGLVCKETSAHLKGVLSGSSMALCRRMAGPPAALRSVGKVLM